MTDILTTAQRSRQMGLVRDRDTQPEMIVRSIVHSLGYRYRLHVRSMPGCPDLVLPRHRKVIFVHGCFWHQHNCTRGRRMPKSHVEYWQHKLQGNKERDKLHRRNLKTLGWRTLVVWECQTKATARVSLTATLASFLAE